jgi:hypothetical protein
MNKSTFRKSGAKSNTINMNNSTSFFGFAPLFLKVEKVEQKSNTININNSHLSLVFAPLFLKVENK